MESTRRPKIVSPAGGSLRAVRAAVEAGADAVYVGVKRPCAAPGFKMQLGLRPDLVNFTPDEIGEALAICADRGVDLLVTLNNLYTDAQLEDARRAAIDLVARGVRHFIVAEPALMRWLTDELPDARFHVSTVATTTNRLTASLWADLGAGRVVLENSLRIEEIASIRGCADVPVEVFVYGGSCLSFHGTCFLASYLGPEGPHPCEACNLPVRVQHPDGTAEDSTLRTRDLDLISDLPRLARAGVDALKINGRMRSVRYVSEVTRVARRVADSLVVDGEAAPSEAEERTLARSHYFGRTRGFVGGRRPEAEVFKRGDEGRFNRMADVLRNPALLWFTLRQFMGRALVAPGRRSPPPPASADGPRTLPPARRAPAKPIIVETSLTAPVLPAGADRICVGDKTCAHRFVSHRDQLPGLLAEAASTGAEPWLTVPGFVPEALVDPVLEVVDGVRDRVAGVHCLDPGLARRLARDVTVSLGAMVMGAHRVEALRSIAGASRIRLSYFPYARLAHSGALVEGLEVPVFGHIPVGVGVFCPSRLWDECDGCERTRKVATGGVELLLAGNTLYSGRLYSAHLIRDPLMTSPVSALVLDTLGQTAGAVEAAIGFWRGEADWEEPDTPLCNAMLAVDEEGWYNANDAAPWKDYLPDLATRITARSQGGALPVRSSPSWIQTALHPARTLAAHGCFKGFNLYGEHEADYLRRLDGGLEAAQDSPVRGDERLRVRFDELRRRIPVGPALRGLASVAFGKLAWVKQRDVQIEASVVEGFRIEEPRGAAADFETARDPFEARARELGVDLIGYTDIPRRLIFAGRRVRHPWLIVLGMEIRREGLDDAPGEGETRETLRTYVAIADAANELAALLRDRGVPAQPSSPRASAVLYPPLAARAGLGRQGRQGVLLTPQFGPRQRLAGIQVGVPLPTGDRETTPELAPACADCRACIDACPVGAIHERPIPGGPGLRTCIDPVPCLGELIAHVGCGICLKVCPAG